jgi:hypothetical protein
MMFSSLPHELTWKKKGLEEAGNHNSTYQAHGGY